MMYWYIERPDELLIDLDRLPRGKREKVEERIHSLSSAIQAWSLVQSTHAGNAHLYVRLRGPAPFGWKVAARLYLLDDPNRVARGILRLTTRFVLIEGTKRSIWREPDYECSCETKHDYIGLQTCSVARKLGRGREAPLLSGELSDQFSRLYQHA